MTGVLASLTPPLEVLGAPLELQNFVYERLRGYLREQLVRSAAATDSTSSTLASGTP